ncbi:U-box domain-containing protein 17-like protein [Carex littledalei]|uniref:RING-type E3 ubiquitin transferase n=1 Tax=Carex littledalei TaxID=544730 RepID=A0A833R4G6_9POAL|nr:U-box domain-containing protein 17-like protein [Carex littledalei]
MSNLEFLSQRRRHYSPLAGAFFSPTDLSGVSLVQTVASLSTDLIQSHPSPSHLHKKHARSLLCKIKILLSLFQYLTESSSGFFPRWFPDSATLCFRELYILIYRAKMLLDYCENSARLWLVLKSAQISGNFCDLNQELVTLLDVLPIEGLRLSADVRDQVELLRKNCGRLNPRLDPEKEAQELRTMIFEFLDEFAKGEVPETQKLRVFLVNGLGISSGSACRSEVDFLEEQIYNQEEDADLPLLGGTVALARYSRFSLFSLDSFSGPPQMETPSWGDGNKRLSRRMLNWSGSDTSSFSVPKDFCCPISLDLMCDPVVVSTGQTYDRASIIQWMDEGHSTCPNSGQLLSDSRLTPNRALRSLISLWCSVLGVPYDSGEVTDGLAETIAAACVSNAAITANMATARILVRQLADGSDEAKGIAARELRLLAKTGKPNRAYIAELGAVPFLSALLSSSDPVTQENAVTALLNLSIHDTNKKRIMEEEGCLSLITEVLKHGWSIEGRENAAATLFSLSVVHDYKKRIFSEPGAMESLAYLLKKGTPRGRKDAVMALFNLSTHPESWVEMLESGAAVALAHALSNESVSEEAAGALALISKQPAVAHAVAGVEGTVRCLIKIMKRGSPKGKENAVAALQEICRRCGPVLTQRVARTPGLGGLVQGIVLTGTKRARRKASVLVKIMQRWCGEMTVMVPSMVMMENSAVMDQSQLVDPSRVLGRSSSLGSGDLTMNQPVAISVPVP